MQIQDEWDEVMREIKQRWDQLARDPQFLRELDAVGEIETYLEQMDIELGRASGPYYLTECYHLYRVGGVEPSPAMLAMVAEAYGRRIFHVRRALYLLRQKLEGRDPQAAERKGEGMYPFLAWLFARVRETAEKEEEKAVAGRGRSV